MRILFSASAVALALAAPASGQGQDFSKVEIKVEKLAPGVAVLFGAGGNIGLSYGEDGNAIIDDQYAPLTDRILAAIKTLDAEPVRFIINTHWHGDHTGGNANLGKAGAVIVAHNNVRMRMSAAQLLALGGVKQQVPASPKEALPLLTFADGVTLHFNGDTMQVIHVANAHTDGDSMIYWRKADVLHTGDVFVHGFSFPFIDLNSGGSIDGMIAAADEGLKLAAPNTRIIPGHGAVASRADFVAYRDMLADIRAKVAAGIAAGQTLTQIQATHPAQRYGMADGFVRPDEFVETVYTSLRKARP
jgi:glyoxylase-like metal-dependent hydrolase (beta-lactamase superfamily II)